MLAVLKSDTVAGLQYIADDLDYAILPFLPGTSSDIAPSNSLINHYLIIEIEIWFLFIFIFIAQ